ncbi:MAG: outer membrane beta-barrel protein [Gemmatimonadota bacterium]|nr:MAG: outer membrane beta-barrel protein [Gemmatimonadota bacterium]
MSGRSGAGSRAGSERTAPSARLAIVALGLLIASQPAFAQEGAGEPFQRVLYVNLFLGANWPVGNMNVVLDPGTLAGGRGEFALSPQVRVGAQLSFHSFDAEFASTADNEGVIVMGVFAKGVGEWGPYQPFALWGLGAYVSKENETTGRRWDGGMQLGAGLEYPISEHFSATTGFGFHYVLRSGEQDDHFWIEGYLGFLFRQP